MAFCCSKCGYIVARCGDGTDLAKMPEGPYYASAISTHVDMMKKMGVLEGMVRSLALQMDPDKSVKVLEQLEYLKWP